MKNTLKLNHIDRTIVMDRTFAKYATDTRSDEYAHLQRVRMDYPNYTVVQRQISRNPEKKTYSGLTYKYMEDYIKTHGTDEERSANLEEFKEKILIARCHGKAFRYPVIKNWFLDKYPEIKNFGMPEEDQADKTKEASADNIVSLDAAQDAAEPVQKGA